MFSNEDDTPEYGRGSKSRLFFLIFTILFLLLCVVKQLKGDDENKKENVQGIIHVNAHLKHIMVWMMVMMVIVMAIERRKKQLIYN